MVINSLCRIGLTISVRSGFYSQIIAAIHRNGDCINIFNSCEININIFTVSRATYFLDFRTVNGNLAAGGGLGGLLGLLAAAGINYFIGFEKHYVSHIVFHIGVRKRSYIKIVTSIVCVYPKVFFNIIYFGLAFKCPSMIFICCLKATI